MKKMVWLLNTISISSFIILIYFTYRILLDDDILPFSISSVHATLSQWAHHRHVLVVGFLPVYIALVFFGGLVLGIICTRWVKRWIKVLLKRLTSL